MASWRKAVTFVGHNVEQIFDEAKAALNHRLRRQDLLQIIPYHGYGTAQTFWVMGRVLENKIIKPATDNDAVWRNLLAMYRRIETDEVPGVRVEMQFQGATHETITGPEGYFSFQFRPVEPLPKDLIWHQLEFRLPDYRDEQGIAVQATGQVLVPPQNSDVGIISDLDDTVIQTHATSLLRMARMTFLNNARMRLPFEGVAAFYRALKQGLKGTSQNPFFYVSGSPWNLYDLLVDFMQINDIPAGPLLLRDFGLDRARLVAEGTRSHKLAQIENILKTYPSLPFILIGDSGQHDAEIYQQVVYDFPDRIQAVYIRDVTLEKRAAQIDAIIKEIGENDVDFLRVEDSLIAAEHAAERGFIPAETLDDIRIDVVKDASGRDELEL